MMRLILPLLVLAVAVGALTLTPPETPLFGVGHAAFATGAMGLAVLFSLLAAFPSARPSALARFVGAAGAWAALLVAAVALYAYRYEMIDVAERVASQFFPAEPQVGRGGEVIVGRRLTGEFAILAKVDDVRVTFLFDTGASVVVLTADDARRVGIDARELTFDMPVTTANGAAYAAETRLDAVAVGPIVVDNVRALVARPGALSESLLGMSFLERLRSYRVERGRLILTAK